MWIDRVRETAADHPMRLWRNGAVSPQSAASLVLALHSLAAAEREREGDQINEMAVVSAMGKNEEERERYDERYDELEPTSRHDCWGMGIAFDVECPLSDHYIDEVLVLSEQSHI